MNTDSFAPLLSCMQHNGLGCKIGGGMMNVESLPIGVWPSTHLDSCGFKRLVDERYFLKYLQGVTSQLPMRFKKE